MTSMAIWNGAWHATPRRHALNDATGHVGKVPELTIAFWVVKIAATTLGETGGDAVSMSLRWGYAASSVLFLTLFAALVATQITARRFHPFLYWSVIVATTTAGTTIADFADRSIGLGYLGGASLLAAALCAILIAWRASLGGISSTSITTPKVEAFYWGTILLSNTLGTALGDFLADRGGLGYEGGALVFGAAILALAVLYATTSVSRVLLFWSAFILTRPLGATLGDLLTKPRSHGGLAIDRFSSSALIAAFMIGCILFFASTRGPDTASRA